MLKYQAAVQCICLAFRFSDSNVQSACKANGGASLVGGGLLMANSLLNDRRRTWAAFFLVTSLEFLGFAPPFFFKYTLSWMHCPHYNRNHTWCLLTLFIVLNFFMFLEDQALEIFKTFSLWLRFSWGRRIHEARILCITVPPLGPFVLVRGGSAIQPTRRLAPISRCFCFLS